MSRWQRVVGLLGLGMACYAGLSLSVVESRNPAAKLRVGVSPVQAFNSYGDFKKPAKAGGGGGRYFTGSLRDGFTCGVCHQSKTYFEIKVSGLGDSIKPGKTYDLKVEWEGEASRVAFNAEVVDAKGFAAGTIKLIEGADKEQFIVMEPTPDKRAPFMMVTGNPASKSEAVFKWTAPDDAPEGPISVHVAAVRRQPDPSEGGDASKTKPKAKDKDERPSTLLDDDELAVFAAQYPFKGSSKKAKE